MTTETAGAGGGGVETEMIRIEMSGVVAEEGGAAGWPLQRKMMTNQRQRAGGGGTGELLCTR